jgi:beta-glucanase (GH16 family)
MVYGTLHGPDASGAHYSVGGSTRLDQPVSAGWHDFAVEKRPGGVRWFVDGEQYFRVTRADIPAGARWPFDHPFYLLLNLAVGGNWPGPPDGTTPFPARLLVDWVRVWS